MENVNLLDVMSALSEIKDELAQMKDNKLRTDVLINSIIARLDSTEKINGTSFGTKRAIKVAPVQDSEDIISVSSTNSKGKPDKNTSENTEVKTSIANSLTYFKKIIMFENKDNIRDTFVTESMINAAKNGVKKPEGTEPYWISVGGNIWKTLDDEQKKNVKKEFINWKKLNQSNNNSVQLIEDDNEN